MESRAGWKSDLARREEHLERSDKAQMSQPQRDITPPPFFLFLISVIYVVVVALTFTLLEKLSSWSVLWLLSCGKDLSRPTLSGVMALLLSRQKYSLNFKMLMYCPAFPGFRNTAWAILVLERYWIWKGQCEEERLLAFQNKSKSLGSAKSTRECLCACMCNRGRTKCRFAVGRTGR